MPLSNSQNTTSCEYLPVISLRSSLPSAFLENKAKIEQENVMCHTLGYINFDKNTGYQQTQLFFCCYHQTQTETLFLKALQCFFTVLLALYRNCFQ